MITDSLVGAKLVLKQVQEVDEVFKQSVIFYSLHCGKIRVYKVQVQATN